jgi:hypothetical protein
MKQRTKTKLPARSFKSDDWDWEQIRIQAEKYAEGNVSAWIRYAARVFKPGKNEKIPLRANPWS